MMEMFLKTTGKEHNGYGVSFSPQSTRMTYDEVISNTTIFLMAGYETTATTLGFITQALVRFPEVQTRLRMELLNNLDKKDIDFSKVLDLPYLEAVIHEAERFNTPASGGLSRSLISPVTYKGVTYPAGTNFYLAAYQIHHDEKNFEDHHKFKPERFLPENKASIKPGSYLGFGVGPRNCIGIRFALAQVKLILAQMLMKYELIAHGKNYKHVPSMFLLHPEVVRIRIKGL